MSQSALIVVTDLDGTLLDHDTYQFDEALPALEYLKQHGIPLILSSSKTAAEMRVLRAALDNQDPFVVENGAGIYLPHNEGNNDGEEKIGFGMDRLDLLATLQDLRDKHGWRFLGFHDMSVEDIMAKTGLKHAQAELAKQRDYTEPLEWGDSQENLAAFRLALAELGLTAVQGGRFISISGKVDKGQALDWLRQYYQKRFHNQPVMIALGDSENDRAMLESADYAILVRSPAHPFPDIQAGQVRKTKAYGPAGWNHDLLKLLDEITEEG